MWNRLIKDEKGFTGLEAAIVLVAFVVVAAVFSYVMLGAGFYTTQKSQEVVHTGVRQASSSLAPSGDVIINGSSTTAANGVVFYVTGTAGGTAVDLDKTVISYTDEDDFKTIAHGTTGWEYYEVVVEDDSAENLVERGEKYKIIVDLNEFAGTLPGPNEVIKLDIKPPEGAVLTLQRTLPPSLAASTYYPVY